MATSTAAPGRVGVTGEASTFPRRKASAGVAFPGQIIQSMATQRINPTSGSSNQPRMEEAGRAGGTIGARFTVRTGWVDADVLGAGVGTCLFPAEITWTPAVLIRSCSPFCSFSSRRRSTAHSIPLRARSLDGLILNAFSRYSTLRSGSTRPARMSQGSSKPGSNAAVVSARRRAA